MFWEGVFKIPFRLHTKRPEHRKLFIVDRIDHRSVDGDTVIAAKGKAGYEWSCTRKWKVARIPGPSTWKRIQGRPGLNDLTKPERDELVRSLRLASTEQ